MKVLEYDAELAGRLLDDAIKYGGLRRDINTVMELAGRLVQEYKS